MNYTQLTEPDVKHMLSTIGVRPLDELDLLADLNRLAGANAACDKLTCFLGGGMYDHFIPTVVDSLAGQSEFVTAYTPYQAEASQGSLQAFYEYQTFVCQLTGMVFSKASLNEGARAAGGAVLRARSVN